MPKKQEEGKEDPPNVERAQRQAAADENAAGTSNEAPAPKRPRGRPPKAVPVEPIAPKPIATTAARKLRKTADATEPASENPFTSKAVKPKAPRVSRRKRSRSSSASSANDTASEAPMRRSARRRFDEQQHSRGMKKGEVAQHKHCCS
ncbi:histone H1.0-like [Rhipicephalus sanguineus]|uniref:histone H1.0-like n=1 Tax=Rhipicephalus sanguineus TaxID=34632 RepID=UPI0020C229CD|nr:histone H1.0-like [Rhipicephalus sanguineus]